jgi:hypothetical protein
MFCKDGEPSHDVDSFFRTLTCCIEDKKVWLETDPLNPLREQANKDILWKDFAAHWKRDDPGLEGVPWADKQRLLQASPEGDASSFGVMAMVSCIQHGLFRTDENAFGMCSLGTEPGDLVVICLVEVYLTFCEKDHFLYQCRRRRS